MLDIFKRQGTECADTKISELVSSYIAMLTLMIWGGGGEEEKRGVSTYSPNATPTIQPLNLLVSFMGIEEHVTTWGGGG